MSGYIARLRRQIGPHLLPLTYATAFIRDAAGRILFQHRADFGAAWWGLPGGLLEPGEAPITSLQREVQEETGLHVAATRLIGVYSSPRYNVTYPNEHQAQQITSCYECRITGGELRPQAEEIVALRFFAPEALPPQPPWYADMTAHALTRPAIAPPYFDPPEQSAVETPFPSLMAVRAIVGRQPLVWPGANTVVRDDAGRVLLQQRADTGTWGLPAGSLDTGETLAHTAIRETLEETGLHIEPTRLVGIFSGYRVEYPNGDVLYPVAHTFEARVTGGALRADGHETVAVGFFSLADLPPLHPSFRQRIELALGVTLG